MSNENRDTANIDRRSFVKASLIPALLPVTVAGWLQSAHGDEPAAESETAPARDGPEIIDTNVHLFDWPFRKLKYAETGKLIAKLRRHRITSAWAGNFEALLHRQFDAANRRLAEECKTRGEGMLIPFGSVNPNGPDWEEDLARCHERYAMPGIRLYPGYHGYALDDPQFERLLGLATERGLLVQIALRMEDDRVHHPALHVPPVEAAPLIDVLKKIPKARVQLINSTTGLREERTRELVEQTSVTFDISSLEEDGGVGRLIDGTHVRYRVPVAVDRLLFGSHAPFFPVESAVFKLFESPLDLTQLKKLMRENALRQLAA
jgi:hypothetical protein